jgi:hypothetical protein
VKLDKKNKRYFIKINKIKVTPLKTNRDILYQTKTTNNYPLLYLTGVAVKTQH